jgi:outer membrane receptor protein involved in Fe transport
MTTFCIRLIRSIVTIIFLILGTVAAGQDSKGAEQDSKSDKKEQSDRPIEEILVVGSRRSELLQEVGLAISLIEPEKLVTAGLVTLEDAVDYEAGVHFIGEGNWGHGTVFMRGATQEGSTPVTAIYIDDVPLTPEVPSAWAQIRLFDGMLGDIERVEVVKGPQGTLYGASAVGGVIRYVTRDPSLDKASGRVAVDVSNTAHGEWNTRYKLNGSLPIVKDRLAIGVTGMYADQGGYLDRIDPASGTIEQDINSFDLTAGSLTGLWRIAANTSLKVRTSRYESDSTHFLQDVNYDYPSFVPTYGFYTTDALPSPGTTLFEAYSATLNRDLDWASLTYVIALASFNDSAELDWTPEFGEFIDGEVGSPPGTNTVPVTVHPQADKRIQELRLVSAENNSLEWLAGIYFTDVDTGNLQQAFGTPSGYHLFTFDFPSDYRELAVYGNVTWFLRPDLDITLGTRQSDLEYTEINHYSGLLGAGDPDSEVFFGGSVHDRVATFLLGARWRPSSESSIYLRFANGYRPPVAGLAPLVDADAQANNETSEPDSVKSDDLWSYEIGAKGTWQDGKLGYDVAVWTIDWNDFQAYVVTDAITGIGNSESVLSAYGFEAALRYRPTDQLEIDGSIGYAESSLDDDAPTLGALEGERSLHLPKWTGSLRGAFEFTLARFDGSVSAGLRYIGSYPTAYRSAVPGCGCALNFPVDDYLLLDGSLTLSTDRYGFTLYGTNLLDEYALATARAQDVFDNQFAYGANVRPRTIGVYLWTNF